MIRKSTKWSIGDHKDLRMIKFHLSRLMGERKLKIVDVSRDTGINRGTITRLYHETATRIEFDVLATLCLYLNCDIDDMLELSREEPEK